MRDPVAGRVLPSGVREDTLDAAILVGAGDIGDCESGGDELTAQLLKRILYMNPDSVPDRNKVRVFTLGDNAYPNGRHEDFLRCYGPTWGVDSIKALTSPALGNHEYKNVCIFSICGILQGTATPYFDYFGESTGRRGEGWYSYELGTWRVYVLNTGPWPSTGIVRPGSRQLRWLRRELSKHARRCSVAYFHNPRFSTGKHGDERWVASLWGALYEGGVDVVISGHDHNYQRFEPQNPAGEPDPGRGIRQFIVGTGGTALRGFPRATESQTLAFQDSSTHGVLKLSLYAERYAWEFLAAPNGDVRDAGSDQCRGKGAGSREPDVPTR